MATQSKIKIFVLLMLLTVVPQSTCFAEDNAGPGNGGGGPPAPSVQSQKPWIVIKLSEAPEHHSAEGSDYCTYPGLDDANRALLKLFSQDVANDFVAVLKKLQDMRTSCKSEGVISYGILPTYKIDSAIENYIQETKDGLKAQSLPKDIGVQFERSSREPRSESAR